VVGAEAGAALWAGIGVGIGAVVRNQVPTLIGICAWLLFVEGLLAGDVGVSATSDGSCRARPPRRSAARTRATLLAPAVGLVVLATYAVVVALAGALSTVRRDVA
jgi:hypothetical protein